MTGWGVAIAAAGLGFSIYGASKQSATQEKYVRAAHKLAKQQWEFNWQEARDAYEFALEDIAVAEFNLEQKRKYEAQTEINKWIDDDKLRMFDYNNQVQAYNASVQAMDKQLQFNDIVAELNSNAAKRAYSEKLLLMGFQLEGLDITEDKVERTIEFKRKELLEQRRQTLAEADLTEEGYKLALKGKVQELTGKLDDSKAKTLEAIGTRMALGQTGRSSRKNILTLLAAQQKVEYAITETLNNAHSNYTLNLSKLSEQTIGKGKVLDLNDQKTLDELYNTRVDTDFQRQQLNEQLRSTNLQYEADIEKRKLDAYSADEKARGLLAAKPVLTPELSKPLTQPKPIIVKPRYPRKGPAPIKGAGAGGHGMAALGAGMMSLGTAIAAIPD